MSNTKGVIKSECRFKIECNGGVTKIYLIIIYCCSALLLYSRQINKSLDKQQKRCNKIRAQVHNGVQWRSIIFLSLFSLVLLHIGQISGLHKHMEGFNKV